jgi:hypothetical protein
LGVYFAGGVRRSTTIVGFCAIRSGKWLGYDLFFRQLTQTPVSRFFAFDVLISAITLWVFVFLEGRRLKMKNLWVYVFVQSAGWCLVRVTVVFVHERTKVESLTSRGEHTLETWSMESLG